MPRHRREHSDRRHPLELVNLAYAFVDASAGTDYNVSQLDIYFTIDALLPVSPSQTYEYESDLAAVIHNHNHETRDFQLSWPEMDAIGRFNAFMETHPGPERKGPDLAIKVFKDMDTVFFKGMLFTHVSVTWNHWMEPGSYAETTEGTDPGQARIFLNPHSILWERNWVLQMFQTLLHEMVVSELDHPHALVSTTGSWTTNAAELAWPSDLLLWIPRGVRYSLR